MLKKAQIGVIGLIALISIRVDSVNRGGLIIHLRL